MRRRLLLATALVLALPATAHAGDITKAKRLLTGKRFVTHISSQGGAATIDRSADLCKRGRFVYTSTFLYPEADQVQEQTVTGRWRVTAAKIKGSFGTATVRYTADDGSRGTVRLVANQRGVYVNGAPAEVLSAGC